MKTISKAALACIIIFSAVSCWKETYPTTASSRPEVKEFTVTAGDEEISLKWSPYEETNPEHYIITYTEDQQEYAITTDQTSYVLSGLINDLEYLIGIQAVYPGDLISNKKSGKATPKTSRFPVKELSVESGNAYIALEWKKPHETLLKYELKYWTEGEEATILEINKDEESYRIENLKNVTLYNLALCGIYERGASDAITAVAMPCEFAPYTIDGDRIVAGRPVTFRFNTDDYPDANGIVWHFGEQKLDGPEISYTFFTTSAPDVKLSATISGNEVTWPVIIPEIDEYVFDFQDFSASGNPNNGFYSSTPVFSPDGKTVYQTTSENATLYALEIETGDVRWSYTTSESCRFSSTVNPVSGDIYFATNIAGGCYCISPDGQLKWKFSSDAGFSECGPGAVKKDGSVFYIGDVEGTIYAIDAASGELKWKNKTGGGITGGVLSCGDEILFGTDTKVFFLNGSDGSIIEEIDQQMWKTTGFAVSPDRKYAYLSCKDKGKTATSIARINIKERKQDKILKIGGDNTWGIAINSDGIVFAGNKDGYLYATDTELSEVKWSFGHENTDGKIVGSAFNFSHPVADSEGNFIITSAGNDAKSHSTTYRIDGQTGKLKDSWHYSGDKLGDSKTFTQQAGNNLIDGYFFSCYNAQKNHPGSLLCKYIGAQRATSGWPSIGGDIFNSNCIE